MTQDGRHIDRLPPWITRVVQDLSVSPVYDGARPRSSQRANDANIPDVRPAPLRPAPVSRRPAAVFWDPPTPYVWQHARPTWRDDHTSLRIYEMHGAVRMAGCGGLPPCAS